MYIDYNEYNILAAHREVIEQCLYSTVLSKQIILINGLTYHFEFRYALSSGDKKDNSHWLLEKVVYPTQEIKQPVEKPPLGISPRKFFEEEINEKFKQRKLDLLDAMKRFVEADKEIPEAIINEFREY